MNSVFWKRHVHIKKAITIVVAAFFAANYVLADAWAAVDPMKPPYAAGTQAPDTFAKLDIETFTIPQHLGEIKYSGRAEGDRFIVHIQDAHCNSFAQKKISEIINYLNKEYGLSLLNLEGGAGEYDLRVFTAISGEAIREEVAEYFVDKGEINGAELYAINNPDKVMLWGIEDKELYLDNLKVYRDSLSYRPEVEKYLKEIGGSLENLKRRIYTPELMKLDSAYNDYKSGRMDFRAYLEFMVLKAGETGVSLDGFRDVELLAMSMEQEGKVDFKKANAERDTLIEELRGGLSMNEMRELIAKTVDFKAAKISRKDFYGYLFKKARALGVNMDHYAALSSYFEYINLYESVDRVRVMKELDGLDSAVRERLFKDQAQRELSALSRNLALLNNIFNITLTKTDYMYYQDNKTLFKAENFVRFIKSEAPKYKVPVLLDGGISKLDRYLEEISRFYSYSFERDKVFLKNMRFGENPDGSKAAVLMTGGFHTENLCDLFEKEKISYVSVIPRFTFSDDYKSPYFEILAGESFGIEGMLKSVIAQAAMLQIASRLTSLGDAVWGQAGQYAFRAAVYVQSLIAQDKKVALINADGTEVLAPDGKPVVFGDRGRTEKITLAKILAEAGYKGEVAPPAAAPEKKEAPAGKPEEGTARSLLANLFSGEYDWMNWPARILFAGATPIHEAGHLIAAGTFSFKGLLTGNVLEGKAPSAMTYIAGPVASLAAAAFSAAFLVYGNQLMSGVMFWSLLYFGVANLASALAEVIGLPFGRGDMAKAIKAAEEQRKTAAAARAAKKVLDEKAPAAERDEYFARDARWENMTALAKKLKPASEEEAKRTIRSLVNAYIGEIVLDAAELEGVGPYETFEVTSVLYGGGWDNKDVIYVSALADGREIGFTINLLSDLSRTDARKEKALTRQLKGDFKARARLEAEISRDFDIGYGAARTQGVYFMSDEDAARDPELAGLFDKASIAGFSVAERVIDISIDGWRNISIDKWLSEAARDSGYLGAIKAVMDLWLSTYNPETGTGCVVSKLDGSKFIRRARPSDTQGEVALADLSDIRRVDLEGLKKMVSTWVRKDIGMRAGSARELYFMSAMTDALYAFLKRNEGISGMDIEKRIKLIEMADYEFTDLKLLRDEVQTFVSFDGFDRSDETKHMIDLANSKIAPAGQPEGDKDFVEVIRNEGNFTVPEAIRGHDGKTYTLDGNRLLGSGTFGVVFKAAAPDGRPVVIKILSPEADDRAKIRFLKEYLFMRRLEDVEGVIKAYGAGQYELNGKTFYYMVQEYAEMGSLEGIIEEMQARGGKFKTDIVIGYARQIFSTLARMHERNILHLDIKPANILVARDGRLKIADFGLAMSAPDNVGKFRDGFVEGTPAYIPNRVWTGGNATVKSDVYAAGIILYEMLHGREAYATPSGLVRMLNEYLVNRYKEIERVRRNAQNMIELFVAQLLEENFVVVMDQRSRGLFSQDKPAGIRAQAIDTTEQALEMLDLYVAPAPLKSVAQKRTGTVEPSTPMAALVDVYAGGSARDSTVQLSYVGAQSLLANVFKGDLAWIMNLPARMLLFAGLATPVHELAHFLVAGASRLSFSLQGMFTGRLAAPEPEREPPALTFRAYLAGPAANMVVGAAAAVAAALLIHAGQPVYGLLDLGLLIAAVTNLTAGLAEVVGLAFGRGDIAEAIRAAREGAGYKIVLTMPDGGLRVLTLPPSLARAWDVLEEIRDELKRENPGREDEVDKAMDEIGFTGGFTRAMWFGEDYLSDLDMFMPADKDLAERVRALIIEKTGLETDVLGHNKKFDPGKFEMADFTMNKLVVFYDGTVLDVNGKAIPALDRKELVLTAEARQNDIRRVMRAIRIMSTSPGVTVAPESERELLKAYDKFVANAVDYAQKKVPGMMMYDGYNAIYTYESLMERIETIRRSYEERYAQGRIGLAELEDAQERIFDLLEHYQIDKFIAYMTEAQQSFEPVFPAPSSTAAPEAGVGVALDVKFGKVPYNELTQKEKWQECIDVLEMGKELLTGMSRDELMDVLRKVSGNAELGWDGISGSVNMSYLAEGAHKHVLRVEFLDKDKRNISVLLAAKKEKGRNDITSHELQNLIRLKGDGVPRFGGNFVAKDGRTWYVEEFIEGPTLSEIREQSALTDDVKQKVVANLLGIARGLNGMVPRDIHGGNFILREDTGEVVMVDIGDKRLHIMGKGTSKKHIALFVSTLAAQLGSRTDPAGNDIIFDAIASSPVFEEGQGLRFLETAMLYGTSMGKDRFGGLFYTEGWMLFPNFGASRENIKPLTDFAELLISGLKAYLAKTEERRGPPAVVPEVAPAPAPAPAAPAEALPAYSREAIKTDLENFVDTWFAPTAAELGMPSADADDLRKAIQVVYDLGEGNWKGDDNEYAHADDVRWHDFTHVGKNALETLRAMAAKMPETPKEKRAALYRAILITGIAGMAHDVGYYADDADGFGTIKVDHEQRSKEFIMKYGEKLFGLKDPRDKALACLIISATEAGVTDVYWNGLSSALERGDPKALRDQVAGKVIDRGFTINDDFVDTLKEAVMGAKLLASLDIFDTREDAIEAIGRLRGEFKRDVEALTKWLKDPERGFSDKDIKDLKDMLNKIKSEKVSEEKQLGELIKRVAAEKDMKLDVKGAKAIAELSKIFVAPVPEGADETRGHAEQVKGTLGFYNFYASPRVEKLGVWGYIAANVRNAFDVTKEMVIVASEEGIDKVDLKALRDKAIARIAERQVKAAVPAPAPAPAPAVPAAIMTPQEIGAAQVEAAKGTIGDLRRNVVDWVITPMNDLAVSQKASVDTATTRKLKKDYGADTFIRSYLYDSGYSDEVLAGNFREALERAMTEMLDPKYGDKKPRAIMYVPTDKYSLVMGVLAAIVKGPEIEKKLKDQAPEALQALAERITVIKEDNMPADGVVDEVMHVVLGKGLLNAERFRKGEFGADVRMDNDAKVRLLKLLNTLAAGGLPDDPAIIDKILDGLAAVQIRPVDFTEITDWKAAQDEVLRSL